MYLSAKDAVTKYNVTDQTLRVWANEGRIQHIKTQGGHRRYLINDNIVNGEQPRRKIIYARVSSKKQETSIENQIQLLKEKYPDYEVLKDIGSGINYKRKNFRAILESLFAGTLEECVVTSSDRFARYGDFFEWLFTQFNSKLISLQEAETDERELADDLMEIVTVFSARYHGRRRYKRNEKDKTLPDQGAENII